METNLEMLLAMYRKDGTQLKRVMDSIASRVYKNPRLYGLKCEDDIGELFSRFWHRIETMLSRYQDNGSSFEAYLVTTLRYISFTLYRERVQKRQAELTYINDSGELSAMESASRYSCSTRHRPSRKPSPVAGSVRISGGMSLSPVTKQHLSILCVKCSMMLSDDEVLDFASKMDVDFPELLKKVHSARRSSERQIKRREQREQLRNSVWFKILVAKRKLTNEFDESKRDLLANQIERYSARYESIQRQLQRMKLTVSNKELAELFQISKTSVDSGQFRLRKRFQPEEDET